MADIREVFPVLVDAADAGVSLRAIQEGDAPSTKNGILGFAFKDSSGNVVMPQLNSAGELKVNSNASGTKRNNFASNTGSLSDVTIATLTLTASALYREISLNVSCMRDSLFQVIKSDNAVETILDAVLVGPGQFSVAMDLSGIEFTAGATGAQLLFIRAKNLQNSSTMRARISAEEIV